MVACGCTKKRNARTNTNVVKARDVRHATHAERSGIRKAQVHICKEENCDVDTSTMRGCNDGMCHLHCVDRTCPVHLPVHLLRRNTETELPPLKMVNGIWVIDSSKNVDGNPFSEDMRGIINPFETPEDVEHFRNAKKKLAQKWAECSICFEPMCLEPICILMNDSRVQKQNTQERRACSHVHHVRCIDGVWYNAPQGCMQNCPLCRAEFTRFLTLPTDYSQNKEEYWKLIADSRELLPWAEVAEVIPCILPVDPRDLKENEERIKTIYCTKDAAGQEGVTEERFTQLISRFLQGLDKDSQFSKDARTRSTMASAHKCSPLSGADAAEDIFRVRKLSHNPNPDPDPNADAAEPASLSHRLSLQGRNRLVRKTDETVSGGTWPSIAAANWFGIWNGNIAHNDRMTCCELVRACIKTFDPEHVQSGVGGIEMAVRAMWNDLDPDKKGYITSEDFYGARGRIFHDTFGSAMIPGDDLLKERDATPLVDTEALLSSIQLTAVPRTVYSALDGDTEVTLEQVHMVPHVQIESMFHSGLSEKKAR